jgi:hypothetical protein
MNKFILRIIPALLMLILAILACNLPQTSESPSTTETSTPSVAAIVSDTVVPPATALPSETAAVVPVPTPQDPLVARAALCWWGPGPVYDVISSLKENIRVKLVGRGSIPGWVLVDNPTYHVPCWVQDVYLQMEPGTDLSSLQIFTPPPTPTPSPTLTRTPTATSTNTPTKTPGGP